MSPADNDSIRSYVDWKPHRVRAGFHKSETDAVPADAGQHRKHSCDRADAGSDEVISNSKVHVRLSLLSLA